MVSYTHAAIVHGWNQVSHVAWKGWNAFMKKLLASLLSIVLLVSLLTASVYAQPGQEQENDNTTLEENTTTENTTTENTTTENTTTTKDETPSTAPAQPRFSFVNNVETDNNGNKKTTLTITWNAKDLPGVSVSVEIDGTLRGMSDNTGSFTVPLDDLRPGLYDMTYRLSDGRTFAADRQVEVAGSLTTRMTLSKANNRITAKITDEHGRPIKDYPINLFFDKVKQATETTDASGSVTFRVAAPSDQVEIFCTADNRSVGVVHYTGCTASFGPPVVTPTTTTTTTQAVSTTTTTKETPASTEGSQSETNSTATAATSAPTYEMIQGAGTTALVGKQIAVNTSFDTQVAQNFGYSTADFASRARLLLSEEIYSSLVGQSGAVLMLETRTSQLTLQDPQISQAISGQSPYSNYSPKGTLRIYLDLSLHLINQAQGIDTPVAMPGGEVTIEFPLPASMNDEEKYDIVVAMIDENGTARLLDTTVKDGSLSFKTTSFSSIAVLGFERGETTANKGGIPTISIVLIVLGVLMLGGAGTLLYFFFIRKPAPDDPDDPDNGGDDLGDGDIRPYPPSGPASGNGTYATAEEEASFEQAEESAEGEFTDTPDTGISLGSIANRTSSAEVPTTRRKNPSDYDIDL